MWVPSIVELLGRLFFFKAKLKNIVSFLMYKTFLDQFWYVFHSKKKNWYVLCFWYMFFLLKNGGNFVNRAIVHSKVYNTPQFPLSHFSSSTKFPKSNPLTSSNSAVTTNSSAITLQQRLWGEPMRLRLPPSGLGDLLGLGWSW